MVPCDIAQVKLPEHVKRLADGIDAPPPSCGHCRKSSASLRCSRCKCVKYCSLECQKEHFSFHKQNCRSIDKKRTLVLKNWADEKSSEERENAGLDEIDAMTDLSLTHLTTVTTIEFADLLVRVGYRESDTVANGMVYYREALKYYLMPLALLDKVYHSQYSWVEDRIILMIVVLGGDESHLKAWFTESGSLRAVNYNPSVSFVIWGCERTDDNTFQAMQLLSHLKQFRDASTEKFTNLLLSIGRIPQQSDLIVHLKTKIPLKPCHAPELFSDAVFDQCFFPDVANSPAPSELWMIYQDCFFENDLVQFLPE